MTEPSNEITGDCFESVVVRPVISMGVEHRRLVHLCWRTVESCDRLVQVYIDGLLSDVTNEPSQSSMWLSLDRSRAHVIELLSVPVTRRGDIHRSHRDKLWRRGEQPDDTCLSASLSRVNTFEPDTRIRVYLDGELRAESALWDVSVCRTGFGNLFGEGGFGFDGASGPGLGLGSLGGGSLHDISSFWTWRSPVSAPGEHLLTLQAISPSGVLRSPPLTVGCVTAEIPRAAVDIELGDDGVLRWR